MKNFSAKNAEFETVTINNEAAITSADIGTAPNKIPLNKDLGSLAYQDAVNLDDVSADMIELRAIAAEISDSAVDVFVYDTSRDSDGGAWRKRTQHTSWYNEELNTTTRGGRREFPAVAVIVVESETLTIYDGDDPGLPMWMKFTTTGTVAVNAIVRTSGYDISTVSMVNGLLVTGVNYNGMFEINFISDKCHRRNPSVYSFGGDIVSRNGGMNFITLSSDVIVETTINDVAMTVLPSAPIDNATGLPVPTIAVATDGGVSVIKDDGTVVDITVSNTTYTYSRSVTWSSVNDLIVVLGNELGTHDYIYTFDKFNSSDNQITIDSKDGTTQNARSFFRRVYNSMFDGFTVQGSSTDRKFWLESTEQNKFAVRSVSGLTIIDENATNSSKSLYNYITSKYNTGWMPGDIKLAALSDSVVENVGVNSDELIVNSDFSTDSNWTKGEGWSIVGGVASKVSSTNSSNLTQEIDCVIGQTYVVSWDITSRDSSAVGFYTQSGGSITAVQNYYESVGSYSETFTATSGSVTIALRAGSTAVLSIDNISVRATTELITNGDFSNGTTGWGETSSPTLTVIDDGVNLKVLSGDNQAGFHQNINANNINQKYILSFEASDFTGDNAANLIVGSDDFWSAGGSLGLNELINTKEDGSYSVSFNGRTNGMSILFRIYDVTGACSVDTHMNIKNISVRPAEEDRSVNDNGLQIVGEINKTPVASGADLVAYSGFSANNYLVQPYNADLDFGTGDFCVMGWAKTSSTENQKIFTRDLDLQNRFQVYLNNGGVSVFTEVSDEFSYFEGSTDVNNGGWFCFCCVRRSGILEVYVNGNEESSQDSGNHTVPRDINFGQISSFVGIHIHNTSNFFSGSIALFRISKTAPTAEQIAKIYRDEKPLFQEGAQATLYGTSDAVTALAYDDKTELLHVGTASGRSDFRGLARVNNTTTAISNSISAAEGTIIQN